MPFPLAAAAILGSVAEAGITSAFNAWQAGKNRDFQEKMSDTAHQREVADLRAAGLNPILSARYGGSSTPSGSVASAGSLNATERAMQALSMKGDLAVKEAQTKDLNSAAALKDTQANDITYGQQERIALLRAQTQAALDSGELNVAERRQKENELKLFDKQMQLLNLDVSHSAYDLERAKREAEFYKGPGGKGAPWMKFSPFTGSIPSLIRR